MRRGLGAPRGEPKGQPNHKGLGVAGVAVTWGECPEVLGGLSCLRLADKLAGSRQHPGSGGCVCDLG